MAGGGKHDAAALQDLKARHRCDELAGKWVTLRRNGKKMVGPCPICSKNTASKRDVRFEAWNDGWVCAACSDGGDVIALVQRVEGISFAAAIEWLGGVQASDPERAAKAEAEREARRKRDDEQTQKFREKARRDAYALWRAGHALAGTDVEAYLGRRGIAALPSDLRLRFLPQLPFHHEGAVLHRGPAMLAPIVRADGTFGGVHRTWLDLGQAKGRLKLTDAQGEVIPTKKMLGSKKGGHIHLAGPEDPERLIVGEGIETTLSAWFALAAEGEDLARTAFWSAGDLGNIAGPALQTVTHPTLKNEAGRARRVPGPRANFEAPALPVPASVTELITLGDGDSDPFTTRCVHARACERYETDDRRVVAAFAPDGMDFNDWLLAADGGPAPIVHAIQHAWRQTAPLPSAFLPADTPEAGKSASSQTGGNAENASHGGGGGPPDAVAADGDGDDDDIDLRLAAYPQTDLGNAERFAVRNKGKFLWCAVIGWLFWDGKRWALEGADEKVLRAAHETVRGIQNEAAALERAKKNPVAKIVNEGKKNERVMLSSDILRLWGRESESNGRLARIAEQAKPYLAVQQSALDAQPMMLNVDNGTLVFDKQFNGYVKLRPHDPADLITKLSPVVYDPKAECPIYDRFISEVQPDGAVARFIHQWRGLSLTGATEQRLCVYWGKGKNGKSTAEDIHAYVAGDYSETVPVETFISDGRARGAGQATPDLAILPGVRMLRTSEPDKGMKLAEALIKLATGGEPILARHLNRDYFKFVPQFKLTIQGNYRPTITGADEGIWRRVVLVPWSVTVQNVDRELPEKLRKEASGILNRLLDGLRDWMDVGLVLPEEVQRATADYRADSDPLGRFLAACTAPDAGGRVQSSVMHALFSAWGKSNSVGEWSQRAFSAALTERGFVRVHSDVIWWRDVKLTKSVNDFVDHEGRPIMRTGADTRATPSEVDDVVPF